MLRVAEPLAKRVDERILDALPTKQREQFIDDLLSIVDTLQKLSPPARRCSRRSGDQTLAQARRWTATLRDGSTSLGRMRPRQAAFCSSLRLIISSAICTVLSAAPLRRLSETIHIDSPFSTVASSRMRLM